MNESMLETKCIDPDLLAFVHIEKAAGTTLTELLRRSFRLRFMDVKPLSRSSNRIRAFTRSDLQKIRLLNPSVRCIAGHSIKPFILEREPLPQNIRYITLFRDPVRRYTSHYIHWVEKMGRDLNFDEFLRIEYNSNFQTKKIAGAEDPERAKGILRQRFLLVGAVEQFDEFLLLLKRKLAPWPFDPRYRILNAANRPTDIDGIIEAYRDRIVEKNRCDIELYNFVQDGLMEAERRAYGPGLAEDLAALRRQNALVGGPRSHWFDHLIRTYFFRGAIGLLRYAQNLPVRGTY
jgi:hypothetical protein